jgi:hypothetical protein
MGASQSSQSDVGRSSFPGNQQQTQQEPQQQHPQDQFQQQSACPVLTPQGQGNGYKNPAVYNVYSQRINDPDASAARNPLQSLRNTDVLDPRNNMPLEANQLPCPGQRKPLSTQRVASTIPKGGTDSTWLFPSPQMVFNGKLSKQDASSHAPVAAVYNQTVPALSFCSSETEGEG